VEGPEATTELILFVNGASQRSARAISAARALRDHAGLGPVHLEIADVQRDRALAVRYKILASPTLARAGPLPVRMAVGDLSDTSRVLAALGMTPGHRLMNRPAPLHRVPVDRLEIDPAEAQKGWAEAEGHLLQARETLRAVSAGEVDTLLGGGGDAGTHVFTLATADRLYRMFVENMNDGAATISDAGIVLYANPRLGVLMRCRPEQLVGSEMTASIVAEDRGLLATQAFTGDAVEIRLLAADGLIVPAVMGRSELDADGDRLTCLTFTDLSAQKAQEALIGRLNQTQIDQLKALKDAQAALTLKATHDSLTGLPNRTLFVDRLEQALLRALRSGNWTAVFFIDLDRFKHINDTRGHAAGDEVLKDVADRLRHATRPMDTVARIGGDEFVVLTPDLTNQLEAAHIAARLAAGLGRQTSGDAARDGVTASLGISVSGSGQATAESMLKEADAAMYHAKSLGGNRAELFDAVLSRRVSERAATEEFLRQAIDEHRVVPYYQPIVDLRTGRVAGYEALARIVRTGQNVLSPEEFISVAEECGLVVPLGAQMLAAACRDAYRWGSGVPVVSAPTVAVNLSPRQLEGSELAAQISVVLAESALAPAYLHLEITESALRELRPEVIRQLNRVRDLGVEIGLDDFGTGFASLTHLRRLPVTFVKVDRSLIARLGEDLKDEQVVGAVIELAANLGLRSIAEGIETPQQLDRLCELGCDHAQGYLFARPGPTAEARARYSVHGSDY
jgi:diguanylate cyclase (GGDEF)-like protein